MKLEVVRPVSCFLILQYLSSQNPVYQGKNLLLGAHAAHGHAWESEDPGFNWYTTHIPSHRNRKLLLAFLHMAEIYMRSNRYKPPVLISMWKAGTEHQLFPPKAVFSVSK